MSDTTTAPEAIPAAQLTEIEQRAQGATDGEWVAERHHVIHRDFVGAEGREESYYEVRTASPTGGSYTTVCKSGFDDEIDGEEAEAEADAEFIAHARLDIPVLLAEVRRLNSAIGAVTQAAQRASGKGYDLDAGTDTSEEAAK